jgi:hypothetical protein
MLVLINSTAESRLEAAPTDRFSSDNLDFPLKQTPEFSTFTAFQSILGIFLSLAKNSFFDFLFFTS